MRHLVSAGSILVRGPTGIADATLTFSMEAQPIYHKNFDLVSESFHKYLEDGYTLYILSDVEKQATRIRAIFEDRGDDIPFTSVNKTIHEGFADETLRVAFSRITSCSTAFINST